MTVSKTDSHGFEPRQGHQNKKKIKIFWKNLFFSGTLLNFVLYIKITKKMKNMNLHIVAIKPMAVCQWYPRAVSGSDQVFSWCYRNKTKTKKRQNPEPKSSGFFFAVLWRIGNFKNSVVGQLVGRLIWDEDIVQVRVLSTLLFQDMGESGRPRLPWTQENRWFESSYPDTMSS